MRSGRLGRAGTGIGHEFREHTARFGVGRLAEAWSSYDDVGRSLGEREPATLI